MGIRITAKKDGFRRCGIAHSKNLTDYPGDKFNAAQLKALKAEPMLVVQEIEDEIITPAPADMTVAELKELLERLNIEIPANAKKADLIELVTKNTAEPPKE